MQTGCKGRKENVQQTLDADSAGRILLHRKVGTVACNGAMLFHVQNLFRKFTTIQKRDESSKFEWNNEGVEVAVIVDSS